MTNGIDSLRHVVTIVSSAQPSPLLTARLQFLHNLHPHSHTHIPAPISLSHISHCRFAVLSPLCLLYYQNELALASLSNCRHTRRSEVFTDSLTHDLQLEYLFH